MKDKIYQYIKAKSGGIDSDEIIREFFHIRTDYPKQMLDIVEQMMSGDSRFIRDRDNLWNINKKMETISLAEVQIAVVDADYIQLDAKRTIPSLIGVLVCKNTDLIFQKICEIDYPFDLSEKMQGQIEKQKEYLDVERTTPANLATIFNSLDQSILIHTAPARFVTMLNQLFRKRIGMELEIQSFSLGQILKGIDPHINMNSFEAILDALEIQHTENPDLNERLQLRWAIIMKMIEKLSSLNITTRAQLEEFVDEKNSYIDFNQFNFDESYLKDIPQNPGVYLMRSSNGSVFYVGKAKNLRNRLQSYFIKRSVTDKKIDMIFGMLFELTYEETGSELEALLLENQYIHSYQPEINRQIAVDTDHSLHIEKEDLIVFLPALEPDFIAVFFIKKADRMYLRRLQRHADDLQSCEALASMFYDERSEIESEYSVEQIEIFWRWIWLNKDNISHISPSWYSSPDELLEKISLYISDTELLHKRIAHL